MGGFSIVEISQNLDYLSQGAFTIKLTLSVILSIGQSKLYSIYSLVTCKYNIVQNTKYFV